MVLKSWELVLSRRQIDAMIDADPVEVVFRRRTRVPVPGGGWRWDSDEGIPLAPQQVTLIPFKRRMTQFLVNTELGNTPELPYILLGRHDLDIQRGDTFTTSAGDFVVGTVDIGEPEVKIAAEVDYFGGGDNNG